MKNELKTYTFYQVYIRNYTKEGTFKALINKLDYIKDLGVKVIQLLPINEIGIDGRKGSLGSPYSIQDYYKINHELGTLDDFKELIHEVHKRDMFLIMDVVFNHTSRDSVLIKEHPEFYYRNNDGNFANHFGDWSDVYDLNYTNNLPLIDYITNVLIYYTNIGVDGYRFDVASLLPNEFYKYAFPKIKEINKNIILLGEAVDPEFANFIREKEGNCCSDSELYGDGFDLLYRYSNYKLLREYLEKKDIKYLNYYKNTFLYENVSLPVNALKIGTIENHDYPRIASFTKSNQLRKNLNAFIFFIKGAGFVYGGQEAKEEKLPNLFDKDTISTKITDLKYFEFIKKLILLKSNEHNLNLIQSNPLDINQEVLCFENIYKNDDSIIGLFNLSEHDIEIQSPLLVDGKYVDLISNNEIIIKNKSLNLTDPLYLKKVK